MKSVLECVKNVFKGEEVVKRHLLCLLILFIPSLCGSMRYIVDKDTPHDLLVIGAIVMGILLLLSIVPGFFWLGVCVDFYKSRWESSIGLPKINLDTFIHGLKVFPITFVWGLYYLIFIIVTMFVPVFFVVFLCAKADSGASVLPCFLSILLCIVWCIFISLLCLCCAPFYVFNLLGFAKDFEYKAKYFNPLIIFSYMKKSFKETILVVLKVFVVSLIMNLVTSSVFAVIIIFFTFMAMVISLFMGSSIDDSLYSLPALAIMLPVIAICSLLYSYSTGMLGLASSELYLKVYKEKICIEEKDCETEEEIDESSAEIEE